MAFGFYDALCIVSMDDDSCCRAFYLCYFVVVVVVHHPHRGRGKMPFSLM